MAAESKPYYSCLFACGLGFNFLKPSLILKSRIHGCNLLGFNYYISLLSIIMADTSIEDSEKDESNIRNSDTKLHYFMIIFGTLTRSNIHYVLFDPYIRIHMTQFGKCHC
jgi:hypothetical protein